MRMQKMLKYLFRSKRQRCVGVEPTRDCAKQPPNRFEDGETHRGPYTSMAACIRIFRIADGCYCATLKIACQAVVALAVLEESSFSGVIALTFNSLQAQLV